MRTISICLLVMLGCRGADGLKRHEGPAYEKETASWQRIVNRLGGDGMWIVSRGYHAGDDFVAVVTNARYSHAVILDLSNQKVVEAVGNGVMRTPLRQYLAQTHRFLLIRPKDFTPGRGRDALRKAQDTVGKKYDFAGIVGKPDKDKFYCSELAVWSWGFEVDRGGVDKIVHPEDLSDFGNIVFESGRRDGVPE